MKMSDIPTTKDDIKKYKMGQKAVRKEERMQTLQDALLMNMISTSKQLLWILVINGILWIWCSYVLAFMGRDQIAESLSSNVCTVIIGQIIAYYLSKTIENVFKFNDIGGPATATSKATNFFNRRNKGDVENEYEPEQTSNFEGNTGINSYEPVTSDNREQFNSECLD